MALHTPISFHSRFTGDMVTGEVLGDHDTYVTASWVESDGSRYATALWKGLILNGDIPAPIVVAPAVVHGTLSLFDADDFLPSTAPPLAHVAAQQPARASNPDEVVHSLAEVILRSTGQHSCYLRGITRRGLIAWEQAGFGVRAVGVAG
jgi:hypothetical protein